MDAIEFVSNYKTYLSEIEQVVKPECHSVIGKLRELDPHDLVRPESWFHTETNARGYVWTAPIKYWSLDIDSYSTRFADLEFLYNGVGNSIVFPSKALANKYCQYIFSAETILVPRFNIVMVFMDFHDDVDSALAAYSTEGSGLQKSEQTKIMVDKKENYIHELSENRLLCLHCSKKQNTSH